MSLFQKVSNWMFGAPQMPTSTITKVPEVAPVPTPEPVAPVQEVTVSVTEAVTPTLPKEENTLTLNMPSEWPFPNSVPAAMTATKKPRKPRSKKK